MSWLCGEQSQPIKKLEIKLRIEKIYDCEGMNEETSVDDVLVVYCALYPDAIEKETYVVGWYKHATVISTIAK